MNILNSIHNTTPSPPPLPMLTPFTFNIVGTNYTGTASVYPITVRGGTYGSITNINSTTFFRRSFTIYTKFTVLSMTYGTPFMFGQSNKTSYNYLSLSLQYSAIGIQYYTGNVKLLSSGLPIFPPKESYPTTYHLFTVFVYNGKYTTYLAALYYNPITSKIVDACTSNSTVNNLDPFSYPYYYFAKDLFNSNPINMTVHTAGWYDSRLSMETMRKIVSSSPG